MVIPRDDPFVLFAGILAAIDSGGFTAESRQSVCWQLFIAQAAAREGYPEIAAYLLPHAAARLAVAASDDELVGTGRGVPPSVLVAGHGVAAELARLRRETQEDAQAARARMRAALGPDPAAAAIARLLRAQPRAVFDERPLPEGVAPVEPRAGGVAARGVRRAVPPMAAAAQLRLPPGFRAVRSERQKVAAPAIGDTPGGSAAGLIGSAGSRPGLGAIGGTPGRSDRTAVVAVSQAYDQSSACSEGGYWVLLSDEAGKTWLPPLYTGLRANLPYTVREASALPLLAGDHLRVEVEVKELGSACAVENGPAELAPRKPRRGIYLDIPLATLEQDSDGDGLTDLAEERLLTDPNDADSDRDGLADGVDPTPTIASAGMPPPSSGAAALLLFWIFAKASQPHSVASPPRAPAGACCNLVPSPLPAEKTVFVVGERPWFAGSTPSFRLIVLTAEEAEELRRKVSLPRLFTVELLVLDRGGRRALAVMTTTGEGGRMMTFERLADGWQMPGAWQERGD
ncbi:MAG TPA: thrombospondin type 3 repeat-containing protein [Thermoanaerobaculia bacterium]|nr:thrombospondin type 3 repeat-containing protein [Thermoanaerobaculia bacterium]